MAITFKDGVILGAASRTTTGAYRAKRVPDKLTEVHEPISGCRSGSAADTQAVADIVSYHLGLYGVMHEEGPTTQTAAALFQELCYDNKDRLRYVPLSRAYENKEQRIDTLLTCLHVQCWNDHSRLRPEKWRKCLQHTSWWLITQATVRNWRVG